MYWNIQFRNSWNSKHIWKNQGVDIWSEEEPIWQGWDVLINGIGEEYIEKDCIGMGYRIDQEYIWKRIWDNWTNIEICLEVHKIGSWVGYCNFNCS